jgi:hypothetical protein
MQRYTMLFVVVSALTCFERFSAHHQELKNCTCSIATCQTCVLLSLALTLNQITLLHAPKSF